MPEETQQAIEWALKQTVTDFWGDALKVTKDNPILLVDHVRLYFNNNEIDYNNFSYDDLIEFL